MLSIYMQTLSARLLARLAALPRVRPTTNEVRELRKGREEMKRGSYWTLDDFAHWLMAVTHPQARTKESSTRTTERARKSTLHT